jgi:hypothetical protein
MSSTHPHLLPVFFVLVFKKHPVYSGRELDTKAPRENVNVHPDRLSEQEQQRVLFERLSGVDGFLREQISNNISSNTFIL